MRGFFREIQKTLLRLPSLGVIFAALLLNVCLVSTKVPYEMIETDALKKANAYMRVLPRGKLWEFPDRYEKALETGGWNRELLFSKNVDSEYFLIQEMKRRISQIKEYPEYLRSIQEKAGQQEISIFQDTSEYTRRNLQAAARVFAPLAGRQLPFVNSDTFLNATESVVTDFLILGVLFYLMVSMVVYEKEHGLFRLLRATADGRGALIRAKLLSGALCGILLTLLFWGVNLGIAVWRYGALNLSVPLQAVYGYDGSCLNISVGQYLGLFLLSKMAVYTVISFLVLLLGIKARNTMEIYIGIFLTAGISMACYAVGAYSGIHILHYMNLQFLVETVSAYRFYFNLNFFGYPLPIILLFWGGIIFLGVLLWFLNWRVFTGWRFAADIKRGWKRREGKKRRPNVSLFSHELYKFLISGHGWVILCLLVVLQGWLYAQKDTRVYGDEYYYKQYMERMAGRLDQAKVRFLWEEQKKFKESERLLAKKQKEYEKKKISEAELNAVMQLVSRKLEPKAAFQRVLGRAEFAKQRGTPMVYEGGYLELFGYGNSGEREDMQQAGMMVAALILLLAPYCAGEYSQGMMKLVGTQYYGRRRTLWVKGAIGLLACILVCFIVYAPKLVYIGEIYGYAGILENADAIPLLAGGFLHWPLWAYLAAVYGLRFLAAAVTAALILAVSVKRRNTAQAVSLLLTALALPLGLHMLGIRLADYFSLNVFYSVNQMLNQRTPGLLILGVCVLLLLLEGAALYLAETMGREG
ncbi:hypothetical protein AALA00_11435 [Lachnospiraceae bacterium 46-15]